MITYIKGDLFSTPDKIILHGCNNVGVMGSGVAKIIKEKFPSAYEDYREEAKKGLRLGDVYPVYQGNKLWILNAITQGSYGYDSQKYVSYDAVDMCMIKTSTFVNTNTPISMPKIGAGLGGGNWEVIEAIINHRLANHQVNVYHLD